MYGPGVEKIQEELKVIFPKKSIRIFSSDFLSKKGLNLRSKKYSKYLQSFTALEESGLIN